MSSFQGVYCTEFDLTRTRKYFVPVGASTRANGCQNDVPMGARNKPKLNLRKRKSEKMP